MTKFDVAFNYLVLQDEGSKFVNDPRDPGGATKWGITLATFSDFFRVSASLQDIEEMTASTAKQIYHARYWGPLHCGSIQDLALAVAIFDCGVLYGVGTTAFLVQRALVQRSAGIKLDGVLGDKSVGILNGLLTGEHAPVVRMSLMLSIRDLLLDRIDAVIVANPGEERYRRGWTLRANRLPDLLDDEFINRFKEEIFT